MSEAENSRLSASIFSKVLAALTALTAISGAVLYLAGNVSYRNRLGDAGAQPDVFPQSVEATMVSGYYALLNQWSLALTSAWLWTSVAVALPLASLFFVANRWGDAKRASARQDSDVVALKTWKQLAKVDIATMILGTVLIVYASILLTTLVLLPGLMGQKEGRAQASKLLACAENDARAMHARSELIKDNEVIARGYVFAIGSSEIAIYDIDYKVVRTLDRAGTELRSRPVKRDESEDHAKSEENCQ
ncbi:hypothetical protein [Luteimonas fraxinea]|uniref:hypothetical protein n=1 Tax=Luteimonas fraxinea TaxID=2901869 RepID=UPI001E492350|nr:hypothetical protein [Luteimonas fraxinea]MCD9125998.1 hypothetical protein [Luteimonas fraxinea]